MTTLGVHSTLMNLQKLWQPQLQTVRFRYWKDLRAKPMISRYGRDDDFFHTGLLPRGQKDRIITMPIFKVKDPWSEQRKQFGQNDYIDILGDTKLHPSKLLYNVPEWLRGFSGNEYQMLMRRMRHQYEHMSINRPNKWKQMQYRFNKTYYWFNYRKKVGYPRKDSPHPHQPW